MFGGQGGVIPPQDVAQVSTNWPAGNIDIRMSNYMCQAQQKWTVTPVANAGGYPGSPYFKITIAGTDRTLAAGEDGELVALPAFTGGPEQLWRHRPAHRRHLAHHAQVRLDGQGIAGPFGRRQQFRDARQVRSHQRQATLALQNALTVKSKIGNQPSEIENPAKGFP